MAHSLAQETSLTCPECGQSLTAQVWLIVDHTERPDLAARIHEGTLHDLPCPHCGHQGAVDAPLLLYCPDRDPPLLFSPAQGTTAEQDQEQAVGLVDALRERLGDAWRDEWGTEGLMGMPREFLPMALSEGPEAALRQMAERAQQEMERLREEDPERYRQLEEAARQAMEEAVPLLQAVQEFIEARTWGESRRVVEEHPELLDDEADELLGRLVESSRVQNDQDAERMFEEHRALLRRCRREGVETAFEIAFAEHVTAQSLPDDLPEEFHPVLTETAVQVFRELSQMQAQDPEKFRQLGEAIQAVAAMPAQYRDALVELLVQADNSDALIAALDTHPDVYAALEAALPTEIELRGEGISIPPAFDPELRRAKQAEQHYLRTGDRVALDESIATWEHILSHAAFPTSPERFQRAILNDAGRVFFHRYRVRECRGSLDQALACWQQVVEQTPLNSPDLQMYLDNLALGLHERYKCTKDLTDLEEAIGMYERLIERTLPNSPDLPSSLNNLGLLLRERYARTSNLADLEKMMHVCQQAVESTPVDSPDLPGFLNNLGLGLRDRYMQTGQPSDLEEAVRVWREAVQYTPPESADLPGFLNNLGIGLRERYVHTGSLDDLEEAVRVWQEVVRRTPSGSLDLPMYLTNMGTGLSTCYARTGALVDLEEAIRVYREAVRCTPPNSPNLPGYLSNLGLGLHDRYARTGSLDDLEEAVRICQEAVQHLPSDSPDLPMRLNNLGAVLDAHYSRTGNLTDLEEAIRVYRQAIQYTLPDSPDLPYILNNLGNSLRDRYARTGALEDLAEAIRLWRTALECTPLDSPNLPSCLNNLGNGLRGYYARTGRVEDLEETIRAYQQAVQCTPSDSPDLPGCLDNLGTSLRYRYAHTEHLEDLEQAVEVYDKTMAALDRAFLLSPVAYQLGQQGRWAGLIARAVETHRQAGATAQALTIAEGSKSRLLTALLGRGDLPAPPIIPQDMAKQEQVLSTRLAALDAADLARHGRTTPSGEGTDRVAHLRQRQALLEELRALWEQMIHDSSDDPEAIDYVALRRGDRPDWEDLAHLGTDLGGDTALLSLFTTGEQTLLFVLRAGMDAPEVVEAPLDGTAWQVMLRRFLREVHFHDRTGRRGETWLRPLLPLLEAAAPHLPGARRVVFAPQSGGHLLPWGLLARRAGWEAPVVTVPALGLLERVLRRPASDRSGALVVGNPTRDLPYASEEARRVARILGTSALVGREATRQAVLSRLGEVAQAHFATHAYFAPGSPLDSGIVLADGVLTAREILELGRRVPEFLALSACQTGMAGSLGGDEMAGLSQALLYAGARSLLVSLWTVNDLATAHLMTGFYHRWRKEGQDKATALRDAMEATRQARPGWAHTYYWGAFTLVGDWR